MTPTSKRVEEDREKIWEAKTDINGLKASSMQMAQGLFEMQGEKSDSFRFKLMEDIQTKYNHLKFDCEKRELTLMNSIHLYKDKMEHLNNRINDVHLILRKLDEQLEVRAAKLRVEFRKDTHHLGKQIEVIRDACIANRNEFN